jgi:GntR family transcriptional repressor for pyruvate dehydrogenase complex
VTFAELWEAMMTIEPAAAEHAALRRSPAQLKALERACGRFKRDSDDAQAAVQAVVEFFTAVATASANRVLALAQAPVNQLLAPTLGGIIDRVPQARSRIEQAQARITRAIRAREPEVARTWMEKHIRDFKRGHELRVAASR